jgi:hypothetical protein
MGRTDRGGHGPGALDRLAAAAPDELGPTIAASLRRHQRAGVTTVRDLGDMRGAVLAGRGPDVIAAGAPLTSPRGHTRSLGGEVSGPARAREAVRQRVAPGADVVKITASGAFRSH